MKVRLNVERQYSQLERSFESDAEIHALASACENYNLVTSDPTQLEPLLYMLNHAQLRREWEKI